MAAAGNYYVKYEEVKTNHNNHKVHKFFLVDNTGASHVAATAEEIADAHYRYQSEPAFEQYGVVHGHVRKELILWLEKVIKESEQTAKGQVLDVDHVVHLGSPTKSDPYGTFFVNYRQERIVLANGRRCNQWFLIDQHGKEHLAVTGTERETRDAHYTYYATEAFAAEHPLECNNQSKVLKWIEMMLTHHCPPGVHVDVPSTAGHPPSRGASESGAVAGNSPAAAAGDLVRSPAAARAGLNRPAGASPARQHVAAPAPTGLTLGIDPTAAPSTSNGTGAVSGRSTPALACLESQPASSKPTKTGKSGKAASGSKAGGGMTAGGKNSAGTKHKLVGVAQDAHIKKLRRIAAESEEALRLAQAQHVLQLRKAAAAEAASRDVARRTTAHWMRGGLSSDEEQVLSQWLDQLKQLLADANKEQLQPVPYNAIHLEPDLNQLLATAAPVHLHHAAAHTSAADIAGAAQPGTGTNTRVVDTSAMAVDLPVAEPGAAAATANGNVEVPDTGQGTSTSMAQQQHSGSSAMAASNAASIGAVHLTPQQASTWTYTDPYINKHGLRMVLECLREVAALLIPMKAFESGDLIDTVQAYTAHPHPSVSQLARHCLGVWQRAALGKLRALLAPELLQDPLTALEARIVTGQIQYPRDVLEKQQALQQQLLATAEAVAASAAAGMQALEGLTPALTPGALTPTGTPHPEGASLASLLPGLDLSSALAQASGASFPPTPSLTLPPGLSLAVLQQGTLPTAPAAQPTLKTELSTGSGATGVNGAATLLLAPLMGASPVCGSTPMLATGGPASEGGNAQAINMDELGSPLDLTAPGNSAATPGLQGNLPSVQQAAATTAGSSPASHFLQMLASPIQGLARGLSQSLGQGLWPLGLGGGQPAAASQQQQGATQQQQSSQSGQA